MEEIERKITYLMEINSSTVKIVKTNDILSKVEIASPYGNYVFDNADKTHYDHGKITFYQGTPVLEKVIEIYKCLGKVLSTV